MLLVIIHLNLFLIYFQIVLDKSSMSIFEGLENLELEQMLRPYPKLHSAIFPTFTKETQQNDVTVYQLLMVSICILRVMRKPPTCRKSLTKFIT